MGEYSFPQYGNNSSCGPDEFTCCSLDKNPDQWALILGMVVTMFVIVVGSSGNLLTLCTLAHQFSMKRRNRFIKDMTPDTVLVTNLAIADLFYSAINLPFIFVTYYRIYSDSDGCPWDQDSVPCKVSAFLRYWNAISEWMTLGLMALERSVCIYKYRSYQRKSRWFTTNKTVFYCVLIWCFGMICQIPTLTSVNSFGYNNKYVKCDFIGETPRMLFFALESIVPCFLILIGYIVILIQIHSNDAHILPFTVTRGGSRLKEGLRRSRTTRVILMLLFVYLICVIPLCAYNIAVVNVDDTKNIGILIYCLYWCQYFINNFIYVVSNEKYRRAYCQFLAFVTWRQMPMPRTPGRLAIPTTFKRSQQSVFSISTSSPDHLLALNRMKVRTISECEERHLGILAGDYELQDSSRASSFNVPMDVSTWSSPLPYSQKEWQDDVRRMSLPRNYSFS
ncbi:G-protein coupled receptor moody-like [Palaemon carinicauda]|uniref:G-protein coupled receptor moody-like n=1 Tax=Palaemon carinicauda TaxID=392227 RepID=UPI0035B5AA88